MDRYYNNILVDKICRVMERKGLTKVALAKELHMNEQTLGNYLLKYRAMPYEVAINIVKVLNINLNQLHGLTNNPIDEEDYNAYLKFKQLVDEMKSTK